MRRFSQRNSLVTLSEINITPLLDLAFVLLIIFVITTPMLEGSLNMNLPGQSTRPDQRPPKAEDIRTVEIDRAGSFRCFDDSGSTCHQHTLPRRQEQSCRTSGRADVALSGNADLCESRFLFSERRK